MGRLALKNVCEKRGKSTVRLYFRRKVGGKDEYLRLPDFDDPRFAEEYQRYSAPDQVRQRPKSGTFGALVSAYRQSSNFTNVKSSNTRRNRSIYLALIEAEHGHRSVVGCIARDIRVMRDAYAGKPGKANNWLAVFKLLMAFAEENGWRTDNPAIGVSMLEIGEHEPWPQELLEMAIDRATPMTRLAIYTGYYTGVRISDAVLLQHNWICDGFLQFTTSKNNADVAIPVEPLWLAEIDRLPKTCKTILYDRSNSPFSNAKALRGRIHALMEDLGRPSYISNGSEKVFSFHGLRKNAACYFAERGLNDSEIGTLCGMTPETVRHYTKRARSLIIAKSVADKITRGDVLPYTGGRI